MPKRMFHCLPSLKVWASAPSSARGCNLRHKLDTKTSARCSWGCCLRSRCRMSAEAALAAAAASEGDHAGVQSPRSSSLSPPSDPSQQPAASDGQMVRRSTASREVSLSQSGGCTGSSTSKGATMPGRLTRACAAKNQDTSTGEMPEATLQVSANSMAARRSNPEP